MMPDVLRIFLQRLPPDEAKEVGDWMDENPDAINEMLECLVEG